jgi:hypothetical protein
VHDASNPGGSAPPDSGPNEFRVSEIRKGHARGWDFIPIKGKVPKLKEWSKRPRADLAMCETWARDGNIGLRTGQISGVVVIDDDTPDGAGAAALKLPVTPTVITGSGKRHYYFKAPAEPIKNSAGKLADHLDVRGEGGQVVFPGSIHPDTNQPYTWAPSLSPDDVPLAELPQEIVGRLAPKRSKRTTPHSAPLTNEQVDRLRAYTTEGLEKAAERIAATPEGSRNDKLNREAFTFGGFIAAGLQLRDAVVSALSEAASRAGLPIDEASKTIEGGIAAGEASPIDAHDVLHHLESRSRSAAGPGIRPVIEIWGGELPRMVDEAEDALLNDGGAKVFQFGNCLARLVRTTDPTIAPGVVRPIGSLAIRPIDVTYLVERLTRAATFQKQVKNRVIQVDCPTKVAKTYLSREGCWRVLLLTGVIEAPTLRPDGSILDQPGYDDATGLFFDPGTTEFPVVPASPSRDDAKAALAKLKILIKDFPFVARSDHSAALSAMLTVTVRRSLRTAPAFAFGAPKMSSGKSLLADCVAMVATGRPCAVMTQGKDDDENRKRMLALLLDGESVPCIDNIDRPFGDASMCAVLTQTRFRDRLLGASKMAVAPTNVTWLLTGNNLILAGDISTRVVPCDLDPRCERPEEREFDVDLHEYIPAHRADLVVAALTVLRAFQAAGCPKQKRLSRFGRFEMWSTWIRSALVWLDEVDPCEGRGRIEESDPVREILGNVLASWHEVIGERFVTTAEAIQEALAARGGGNGGFLDALIAAAPGKGDQPDARKLGHWIKRFLNRIEVGLRLERGGERQHVASWRVAAAVDERTKKLASGAAMDTGSAGEGGSGGSGGLVASTSEILGTPPPSVPSTEDATRAELRGENPPIPQNPSSNGDCPGDGALADDVIEL